MQTLCFRNGKEGGPAGDTQEKEKKMIKTPKTDTSSELLREQIKNLSMRMQGIITKTLLYPLQSMTDFNKAKAHFAKTQKQAYLSCSAMDNAQSISTEDKTIQATYALINTLINLKNEASQLVENKLQSDDLATRFRKQLDNVEQWMHSSIGPFIQDRSLNEKNRRQALEALERWAELYRHGLKASGNISERGEEWLKEAHKRLDLTTEALRQLDARNEAIASRIRESQ